MKCVIRTFRPLLGLRVGIRLDSLGLNWFLLWATALLVRRTLVLSLLTILVYSLFEWGVVIVTSRNVVFRLLSMMTVRVKAPVLLPRFLRRNRTPLMTGTRRFLRLMCATLLLGVVSTLNGFLLDVEVGVGVGLDMVLAVALLSIGLVFALLALFPCCPNIALFCSGYLYCNVCG